MLLQHPEIFITTEAQVNLFNGCLESLVFVLPSDRIKVINQVCIMIMLIHYNDNWVPFVGYRECVNCWRGVLPFSCGFKIPC